MKSLLSLRKTCFLWKSGVDQFLIDNQALRVTLHPTNVNEEVLKCVAPLIGELILSSQWCEVDSPYLSDLLLNNDFSNVREFHYAASKSWSPQNPVERGIGVQGFKLLMSGLMGFQKLKFINVSNVSLSNEFQGRNMQGRVISSYSSPNLSAIQCQHTLDQETGKAIAITLSNLKNLTDVILYWPMSQQCFEEILNPECTYKNLSALTVKCEVTNDVYIQVANNLQFFPKLKNLNLQGPGLLSLPTDDGVRKVLKEKATQFAPELAKAIEEVEKGEVIMQNLNRRHKLEDIEWDNAMRENRAPNLSVERLKEIELENATKEGREPDYTYIYIR